MSESEGLHHYKFLYQRFLASTLGWPEDAQMGYVKLLTVQFERGGIPDDIKEVGLISPAARKHWRRIKPKFQHRDREGLLYNGVMDGIRREAVSAYLASVENGKKGGRPKKPDPKPGNNPALNLILNPAPNPEGNPTRTSNEERSNTTPEVSESVIPEVTRPDLSGSNLFRKPKIPSQSEVLQAFMQSGGTVEMAKKFFETNEATGWFYRGSPVTRFITLVPGYISAWRERSPVDSSTETKMVH